MKVKQALIPHFAKFHGQSAALHAEIIRKLLTRERNVELSDHFTVVSFDNPDEFKLAYFPVSCIEQPIETIGEKVMSILIM